MANNLGSEQGSAQLQAMLFDSLNEFIPEKLTKVYGDKTLRKKNQVKNAAKQEGNSYKKWGFRGWI